MHFRFTKYPMARKMQRPFLGLLFCSLVSACSFVGTPMTPGSASGGGVLDASNAESPLGAASNSQSDSQNDTRNNNTQTSLPIRQKQVDVLLAEEKNTLAMTQPLDMPRVKAGNAELFQRGVSLMQDKKYAAAEVIFTELTDSQPKLAGPWVNLGFIHLAADDANAAELMFRRAIKANPKNCESLTQLGLLARRTGAFEEAEQFYQQCLDAQPQHVAATLNLGILYELYMGRYNDALVAYQSYQRTIIEPNPQVGGWMIDLERRIRASVAQR